MLEQVWGDVPPQRFSYLRDELAGVLLPYRGRSILLSLIAAFCVPLAAVGLSGALLYFVRGRTRDTAIRLALGAEPAAVRRDVIRRALTPVAIGIVAGTALGISAGRIAASQLFQVHPADPLTMAAVALGLLGLSWLVALVPAAHASSLDPAKALRES